MDFGMQVRIRINSIKIIFKILFPRNVGASCYSFNNKLTMSKLIF